MHTHSSHSSSIQTDIGIYYCTYMPTIHIHAVICKIYLCVYIFIHLYIYVIWFIEPSLSLHMEEQQQFLDMVNRKLQGAAFQLQPLDCWFVWDSMLLSSSLPHFEAEDCGSSCGGPAEFEAGEETSRKTEGSARKRVPCGSAFEAWQGNCSRFVCLCSQQICCTVPSHECPEVLSGQACSLRMCGKRSKT